MGPTSPFSSSLHYTLFSKRGHVPPAPIGSESVPRVSSTRVTKDHGAGAMPEAPAPPMGRLNGAEVFNIIRPMSSTPKEVGMTYGFRAALRISLILFLVMAFTGAFAAPQAAPTGGPDAASLTRHLRWRSVGPANMVGRISDFEALDNDFTQVLVATASGGVFKSVNAGTTWEPIFDRYGAASIGDVAFFQKDPSIIWVGTGEECVRNSVAWGDGVYKSTDGGKTFAHMGLETTQTIARVLTHPTDPGVVYVAASGHPWGYTGDRGLFKTTDGGQTWAKLAGGLPN